MLGEEEIEHRFGFHKAAIEGPNAATEMHADLRHAYKVFAKILDELLPDDQPSLRYKELAQDDLENSSMWAHKAIARKSPLVKE